MFLKRIPVLILLLLSSLLPAQKKVVDSLLAVLETAPDKDKIKIYLKLSSTVNASKPTRAIYYAKEALYLAREFKNDAERASAWHSVGTAYIYFPDTAEAKIYLDSALSMRRKLEDTLGVAKTLNNLGLLYFNNGHYEKAILYNKESVELRNLTSDKKGVVNTLMSLGHCYRSLGEFQNAYGYFMQGLKTAESLSDDDLIATSNINIAILFSDQKKYAEALKYQLAALEIKQRSGTKKSIASAMSNVGTTYMNMENYSQALHYLIQSLQLREEINDLKGIGTTCNNIAELFLNMGDPKKALEYCERSLNIRKEMGDRAGIAAALSNMADIYEGLGRIQDAINTLEESTSILEELGSKTVLVSNYQALASLYSQQGNYKKAFDFQVKYSDMNDSLFQENTFKQMAELQTKYESAKKEKENELLKASNDLKDQRHQNTKYLLLAIGIATLIISYILFSRYKLKQRATKKLETAYQEIELKNKDIMDSIIYAKRIQDAVLPSDEQVKKAMPDAFVVFQPKDIVSGDFYWIEKQGDTSIFAAVDCTGHGVPGAFLSMVGSSLLNQTVFERGNTTPADILRDLNEALQETLLKGHEGHEVRDGMDVAICTYDETKKELQFAAAFNPLYVARKTSEGKFKLEEIKADKISIGISEEMKGQSFKNNVLSLNKGDCVYIFTDGFADQFGGNDGKKFKYNRFKELILNIAHRDMDTQKREIENAFSYWKGEYDQVDDVLVIGMKA